MKTVIILFLSIFFILFLIAIIRTFLLKQKTSTYHPSDDMELSKEYAQKLQKMIRVETVSIRNQPDPAKFRKLHKVMEELFPNVFGNCEKIDLDGNLLVRWQGKNPDLQPIVLTSHLSFKWRISPIAIGR